MIVIQDSVYCRTRKLGEISRLLEAQKCLYASYPEPLKRLSDQRSLQDKVGPLLNASQKQSEIFMLVLW